MNKEKLQLPNGTTETADLLIEEVLWAMVSYDANGKKMIILETTRGRFAVPYSRDNATYLGKIGKKVCKAPSLPEEPPNDPSATPTRHEK